MTRLKSAVAAALFVAVSATPLSGQMIMGVKGGANFATVDIQSNGSSVSAGMRQSFHGAVLLGFGLKPNLSIEVADLTPRALGELFMLFEVATVYAGALYGVDPLDQPGVELSKRLTYGLLGREGFDRPDLGNADHPWRV